MIIIGAGRVGGALAARARDAGQPCTLIDRTRGWEAIPRDSGPIFVAVRNDDLDPVLERIDPQHHSRLVFTQNGMLRSWLATRDLHEATRGLLFFAVPSRGAALQPGGSSPFVGPHAAAVTQWLNAVQVPALVAEETAFATTELEKLIWNCAFGLLCEHGDTTVGGVVRDQAPTLGALVDELVTLGQPAFGLTLDPPQRQRLLERLCAYSMSIPTYRGAVKEWRWRNGWFVERAADSAPGLHEQLLRQADRFPTAE